MLLLLLAAIAGGVALGWDRIAPLVGMAPPDPVVAFLERGRQALARDEQGGYQEAIREYTRATAIAEDDARVLTALAQANAVWGQSLRFAAEDLEARGGDDAAQAVQAQTLRRGLAEHAEEARRHAEDAVRRDDADGAARLALADALRLSGDATGAQQHLEEARTALGDPSAEYLRVSALLAVELAGGDMTAARPGAEQAVQKDPSMIRTRLLYARALLAAGDVSAARAQIDAVLRLSPTHDGGTSLRDALDQGLPPAQPVTAVPDAGAVALVEPTAADVPAPPGSEPAQPSEVPGATTGTAGRDDGIPRGRDYTFYVARGDEAIERGQVGRARQFYESALATRPGGSEAQTGMGYVALETGDANSAASRFRAAAAAGFADAYIGLGEAYRRLGRHADALAAYERYLERWPTGSRASIARRQAAELRTMGAGPSSGGGTGSNPGGGPATPAGEDPAAAPPTPPGTLPAPRGTAPGDLPPSSDPPAVGTE